MIVAALIAKIHTVEWTPAILGTEALDIGMKSQLVRAASGDWLTRLGIWLIDVHALKGIPEDGARPSHRALRLTEDFVTVYRMHPLLPDDYVFHDSSTGKTPRPNAVPPRSRATRPTTPMREYRLRNVALFVRRRPSAAPITLHNFPERAPTHFERGGEIVDLSVVDIVRTRRRGVPRCNGSARPPHAAGQALRGYDGADPSRPTGCSRRSTATWTRSTA